MRKRGLLLNKKGSEDILFPIVIRIILIGLFFGMFLLFVHYKSTGASVFEQAYSKQIALLIDSAKPSSTIVIDFKDGIAIAEKNKILKENTVVISNNQVIVKLYSRGGYAFKFFSDYEVHSYFNGDKLIITIS